MKKVCSYCKSDLGSVAESTIPDGFVSHGICDDCLDIALAGFGESLEEFLDSLQEPILVVDDDVRVLASNSPARERLSIAGRKNTGSLGGKVFRCKWFSKPGGCGKTLHCKSCTIRNTVSKTFESGKSCLRVPACMDLDTVEGPREVRFVISTEKVKNVVFLRIDDAQEGASS